jgi:hypothetical protein
MESSTQIHELVTKNYPYMVVIIHVPDEEYPNFIKSYYNDVIIGSKIEYSTEKQLDTGGPI